LLIMVTLIKDFLKGHGLLKRKAIGMKKLGTANGDFLYGQRRTTQCDLQVDLGKKERQSSRQKLGRPKKRGGREPKISGSKN